MCVSGFELGKEHLRFLKSKDGMGSIGGEHHGVAAIELLALVLYLEFHRTFQYIYEYVAIGLMAGYHGLRVEGQKGHRTVAVRYDILGYYLSVLVVKFSAEIQRCFDFFLSVHKYVVLAVVLW